MMSEKIVRRLGGELDFPDSSGTCLMVFGADGGYIVDFVKHSTRLLLFHSELDIWGRMFTISKTASCHI